MLTTSPASVTRRVGCCIPPSAPPRPQRPPCLPGPCDTGEMWVALKNRRYVCRQTVHHTKYRVAWVSHLVPGHFRHAGKVAYPSSQTRHGVVRFSCSSPEDALDFYRAMVLRLSTFIEFCSLTQCAYITMVQQLRC